MVLIALSSSKDQQIYQGRGPHHCLQHPTQSSVGSTLAAVAAWDLERGGNGTFAGWSAGLGWSRGRQRFGSRADFYAFDKPWPTAGLLRRSQSCNFGAQRSEPTLTPTLAAQKCQAHLAQEQQASQQWSTRDPEDEIQAPPIRNAH